MADSIEHIIKPNKLDAKVRCQQLFASLKERIDLGHIRALLVVTVNDKGQVSHGTIVSWNELSTLCQGALAALQQAEVQLGVATDKRRGRVKGSA